LTNRRARFVAVLVSSLTGPEGEGNREKKKGGGIIAVCALTTIVDEGARASDQHLFALVPHPRREKKERKGGRKRTVIGAPCRAAASPLKRLSIIDFWSIA